MAGNKKEATLLLKIKSVGGDAISKVGSLWESFKSRLVFTAGEVINAVKQIGGAFLDLALDAAKFKDVAIAFKNLASSQGQSAGEMLANMRKLSAGTISDLKLMQQANTALLLGLPVDRFGDMLEIARSSAKATGQSMDFMLNSIVTGLGRGSKLMLDNLGIMIDTNKAYEIHAQVLKKSVEAMSDAEKKQAFLNEALRIGKENVEKAGDSGDSLTDSWARAKASAENLATKVGAILAPAVKLVVDITNAAIEATNSLFASDENLTNYTAKIEELRKAQAGYKKELEETAFLSASQKQSLEGRILLIGKEIEALTAKQAAEKAALDASKAASDEQAERKRLLIEQEATMDEAAKAAETEREALFRQARKDLLANERILELEAEIAHAETMTSLKDAVAQRDLFKEKLIADQRVLNKKNYHKKIVDEKKKEIAELRKAEDEWDKEQLALQQKKENDQRMAFSRIASLSQSHNKGLAAIGKAAAITQIAIDTPVAITKTLAAFPAPFNFAMAAAVGAAAAVQAGRIAGVQLADGGIVSARMGGTPAILGEGGRDEAVIPLDGSGAGIGSSVTINTQFFMGDESSARAAAEMIDRELFKLRQDNSSIAFDSDII